MKKNKVFNIMMAALIVVIIGIGITIVGMTQGWFKKADPNAVIISEVTGAVQMERNGVGFSVSKGSILQQDDLLATKQNAKATITAGGNTVVLNEKTEIKITQAENGMCALELKQGELFAVMNDGTKLTQIGFQGKKLASENGVFSLSVQTGSAQANCFKNALKVDDQEVAAGKGILFSNDKSEINDFQAASLNAFVIDQAIAASKNNPLCFETEVFQKVLADRDAEKMAQQAEIKNVPITVGQRTDSTQQNSDTGDDNRQGIVSTTSEEGFHCTIAIRCDTILDHMDELAEGKSAFVPSNGTIISTSKVMFKEGETVFDVLKRACSAAGIQLEYSWTPMYNSYYIEGINNLYEFDCGGESGWMYKVNGWFPNYGCSDYTLKDGDSIVWCYTCQGLGADVGASMN